MTPKLLAEFIGTFVLVLTIGLAGQQDGVTAPLAIGMALAVAVYAGGHVSGGHYNPAVSIAAWLRGALPAREVGPYLAAQAAGAFVAAFLTYKIMGIATHIAPGVSVSALKALTGEAVWTFVLAYVVLSTATVKSTAGNSYFGLAIGGTVMSGAYALGGISGGAFNPAVGLVTALFELLIGNSVSPLVWVYAVGPVAGGVVAALAFKATHPAE